MKKTLITLIFAISLSTIAQNNNKQDRIKALKIAFITERLELTEAEAQKFWPIYNSFQAKNQQYRRRFNKPKERPDYEQLTEQEARLQLDEIIKTDSERYQLKLQFIDDLLKILPAKKVLKLKESEHAFNKRVMDQFKKRREGLKKLRP